jgi:DNA-binding transcriptional MocR family regulator
VIRDLPAPGQAQGSRAQQIATEIEAEIPSDRIPAGTRLGLRTDLISRFEVSPLVMNEALRILRKRHLVTVKLGPNGGVIVDSPPPQVRLGGIDVWHQGRPPAGTPNACGTSSPTSPDASCARAWVISHRVGLPSARASFWGRHSLTFAASEADPDDRGRRRRNRRSAATGRADRSVRAEDRPLRSGSSATSAGRQR